MKLTDDAARQQIKLILIAAAGGRGWFSKTASLYHMLALVRGQVPDLHDSHGNLYPESGCRDEGPSADFARKSPEERKRL